jgi:hypothetical protein
MGVCVDDNMNTSFDLLKEIKNARLSCFNKQQKAKTSVQLAEINEENVYSDQLKLEWLQEENSELDDFTVVMSKKRKKKRR